MADPAELSPLDRRPSPRVAVVPLYVVATLVALGLLAAVVVEVDEAVVARGVLIPPGDTTRVMALAGGRVEHLAVAEGDVVVAGAVLVRLEAPEAARLVEALEAQVAAARDEVERRAARVQVQRDLAALEVARVQATRAGRAAELGGVQEAARLARQEAELLGDRTDRARALAATGDTSKERLEDSVRAGTEARADLARVRSELAGRRKELESLEKLEHQAAVAGHLAALDAEVALIEARSALADLLRRLADAESVRERAIVRAPAAGTVHALAVRAAGEVLPDGAVIARLVPTGTDLEAEVEVPAADMATVRAGQPARLSLDAFPFADYGDVAAEVIYVAPDATPGPEGRLPSFRVRLRLHRDEAWRKLSLGPGMPLTARLRGRRESLGWWLLRPLRGASRTLSAD